LIEASYDDVNFNLEDKVDLKGSVLIETWIIRWTLFMGPNQSLGEFILEECRRMMRCQVGA
jgi:hypothetical protein